MYTYKIFQDQIKTLIAKNYKDTIIFSIGKSVMGKDIFGVKIGRGKNCVLYNGTHHALEYITSAMLMRFIDECAKAYTKNELLVGFDVNKILEDKSIYIVPMINPDGVELVTQGVDEKNPFHYSIMNLISNCDYKNEWQANINGVDLNHNYDAAWQPIYDKPMPSRYGGKRPVSEPEVIAMVNITKMLSPQMVIAYHSQGEEIYYDFMGKETGNSKQWAEGFASITGYTLSVPDGSASFGGYKDWFIEEFDREGFTFEVGLGKNPLPFDMLNDIYNKNLPAMLWAISKI